MRYAIIGGHGQLGSEITEVARKQGHEAICYSHLGDPPSIEVTDDDLVYFALKDAQPDVVVNTAALHNVEACEREPQTALWVNALGARNVAFACRLLGAFCIYISTDYVFGAGEPSGLAYRAYDPPAPLNVYGWSKALGEYLTRKTCPESAVVRVSHIFGKNASKQKGGNFVDKVLAKARKGEPLRYYDDVIISPVSARDAAEMILQIGQVPGIYHAVNLGRPSAHAFAMEIAFTAGLDSIVYAEQAANVNSAVTRPLFSALQSSFTSARSWQEALQDYLEEIGARA